MTVDGHRPGAGGRSTDCGPRISPDSLLFLLNGNYARSRGRLNLGAEFRGPPTASPERHTKRNRSELHSDNHIVNRITWSRYPISKISTSTIPEPIIQIYARFSRSMNPVTDSAKISSTTNIINENERALKHSGQKICESFYESTNRRKRHLARPAVKPIELKNYLTKNKNVPARTEDG